MIPVNAPPTATPGALLPREKPNNPKQKGRKTPNRHGHNSNKITHIPQTTDNRLTHDAAEGTNVEDRTAATGGMSGVARNDTPGRVFVTTRKWIS